MKTIDKTKPVMVTGATGYVAGWIVKKLLDEGFTVHAPVRDPQNKEKLKYLNLIAEKAPGKIVYFEADLLLPGSYEKSMRGCELVFHTASPFINQVKDPQRDLIDPALKGTRNVLDSVNKTGSVKRVVLTSSMAAILGDAKDIQSYPGKIATEEQWNTSSSKDHQPYSYSKVLAEKGAWEIADKQKRWDLVVINPALVIGPGINPRGTSESFNIMKMLGDGTMKMGAAAFEFGLVDVRDLAIAHFNAGFFPEAKGRYIIANERKTFLEMANILRDEFGDNYQFPKKEVPKFLVWLTAPMLGVKRKMITNNVGYPWIFDNSKGKNELKIEYRSAKESLIDFFRQMVEAGTFNKG